MTSVELSEKSRQPKALYLLAFVQMWENFSFYGLRAILVLYMVAELEFSDVKAFGIYAIYTSLSECMGVFGGRLADKYLGLKRTIYLGGIILAGGHLLIASPFYGYGLYTGLALIAVGTGLFRANCTALLGEFYGENDMRRDAGFTYFFVGLNIGAFIATLACAFTAEKFGYPVGFSLAAIGMISGLMALRSFDKLLENKGRRPHNISRSNANVISAAIFIISPLFAFMIIGYEVSIYILLAAIISLFVHVVMTGRKLVTDERNNVFLIVIATMFLAGFYGFEEQVGTTLILLAERFSDGEILGVQMSSAALTMISPLAAFVAGPFIAMMIGAYETKSRRVINIYLKIAFAFFLQGMAFASFRMSTYEAAPISSNLIGVAFALIAVSELFIAPALYSYCAEKAPHHMRGLMMGVVMLGYALAFILSGTISRYMALSHDDANVNVYLNGFDKIAMLCILFIVIAFGASLITKKKLGKV